MNEVKFSLITASSKDGRVVTVNVMCSEIPGQPIVSIFVTSFYDLAFWLSAIAGHYNLDRFNNARVMEFHRKHDHLVE